MGWPSSTARRSKTSRGTTSVALPAPNGMVALIRGDGELSGVGGDTGNRLVRTQTTRRDLFIESSGFITRSVARTVPLFAEFPDPEIDNPIAMARYQHTIGLRRKFDHQPAV